jgi:hypothetical protein
MEVDMNRRIAGFAGAAALAAGIVAAPNASAGSNVAVSVGLPGVAVGYSNSGVGFVAAAPAPLIAPAPYFAPAPVVVAPYPFYGPIVARPYFYRPPVRVAYYGRWHRY